MFPLIFRHSVYSLKLVQIQEPQKKLFFAGFQNCYQENYNDLMQNIDTDFPRRCISVKCDKLQSETVPHFKTKEIAAF